MKKIILTLLALFTLHFSLFTAQATNVSGGIYTNTTWTLINSPYIVTDTVVVFPGVTLTIEAGVVVKFADHKMLEVRGILDAIGTSTDSITFTSNSSTPIPGIWERVWMNGGSPSSHFNYCNFEYAKIGINSPGNDSITVKNSSFRNNIYGIRGFSQWGSIVDSSNFFNNKAGFVGGYDPLNTIISNCNFMHNISGLGDTTGYPPAYATIINCVIDSNVTAMVFWGTLKNCIIKYNQTGIKTSSSNTPSTIKHCIIDSNYVVGLIFGNNGVMYDTVYSNEIKYNGTGIIDLGYYGDIVSCNVIEYNNIGINLQSNIDNIYCNKICNNYLFDLKSMQAANCNISNNNWGTTDSATIASHIWDGYDSIALGLTTFMPIDTLNCYLTGCNLQLTTTAVNATCGTCTNGSAHVSMSNGFAPYTFTWNSSPIQTTQTAVNLLPDTYTVCVIDANGCTACHSVYVDSTNCTSFAITTSVTNATCGTCLDGTGTVIATGGTTPYLYSWYTSPFQSTSTATGLLQGTYQVCVSDAGGCHLCDSVTIGTGNCSAHFDLYPDTNILHHYFAVNMASGVPPLTYDWNWGDNGPHDYTPYPSHQYANAGAYNICLSITDFVGCTSTFCCNYYLMRLKNTIVSINVVNPNFTTGTISNSLLNYCTIFPNPFHDKTTIIIQGNNRNDAKLFIYDLFGREVKSIAIGTITPLTINVEPLQSGMYFYKLIQNKSEVLGAGKLIIE